MEELVYERKKAEFFILSAVLCPGRETEADLIGDFVRGQHHGGACALLLFLPDTLPVFKREYFGGRYLAWEFSCACRLSGEGALFRAVHHGEPLRGIPYFGRIAEPRGGALSARASGGSDETQHRRNQGNYGG